MTEETSFKFEITKKTSWQLVIIFGVTVVGLLSICLYDVFSRKNICITTESVSTNEEGSTVTKTEKKCD